VLQYFDPVTIQKAFIRIKNGLILADFDQILIDCFQQLGQFIKKIDYLYKEKPPQIVGVLVLFTSQ
jgi:hypothetical protein